MIGLDVIARAVLDSILHQRHPPVGLQRLPQLGEHVFAGRREGRPISGFSRAKAKADELVVQARAEAAGEKPDPMKHGIADWRLHDLRRTAGTGMARLGVAPFTISRLLNHAEGGVTQIYRRHGYLDEKRHALNIWGRRVENLLRPVSEKVVDLAEARS